MTGATVAVADFHDRLLILAPHMDDESLGCGFLLANHPDKRLVHVAFVTDGSRSPQPPDGDPADGCGLSMVRQREAREALAVYGLPETQSVFLGMEDGTLASRANELEGSLVSLIQRIAPRFVFVPFRYDRHPDHLAVNRAVCAAVERGTITAAIVEYFVYSQWRLLPSGDVRSYLDPNVLCRLEPSAELAELKRRALRCHRSQTELFFGWQSRPILTAELIERVCHEAETYLIHDAARPGHRIFLHSGAWILLAHQIEPRLKRWKDSVVAGR